PAISGRPGAARSSARFRAGASVRRSVFPRERQNQACPLCSTGVLTEANTPPISGYPLGRTRHLIGKLGRVLRIWLTTRRNPLSRGRKTTQLLAARAARRGNPRGTHQRSREEWRAPGPEFGRRGTHHRDALRF